MKHIEEIFGGENAEEQNVLLHIIKERGYGFFEKTPKTTMTVRLLEDLHELGYEIQPKAKNHIALDNVSKCLDKAYADGYNDAIEKIKEQAKHIK